MLFLTHLNLLTHTHIHTHKKCTQTDKTCKNALKLRSYSNSPPTIRLITFSSHSRCFHIQNYCDDTMTQCKLYSVVHSQHFRHHLALTLPPPPRVPTLISGELLNVIWTFECALSIYEENSHSPFRWRVFRSRRVSFHPSIHRVRAKGNFGYTFSCILCAVCVRIKHTISGPSQKQQEARQGTETRSAFLLRALTNICVERRYSEKCFRNK